MTRDELKSLITDYDEFIGVFHAAQFVVDGKAQKIRDLLEELTHDEICLKEHDT